MSVDEVKDCVREPGIMQLLRNKAWVILLALAFAETAVPVHADDSCVDFKWDVTQERALFAAAPTELAAGKDSASAPALAPKRLYKLRLVAQEQVKFSVAPGKKAASAPAFAGLATLKIPAPGSYRISLDLPVWIDVASNGMLIAAKDFQGQHACNAPHKIVEFELAGTQPFVVQFSNSANDTVSVTVTASPQRKF
jgi:hypothetical protein